MIRKHTQMPGTITGLAVASAVALGMMFFVAGAAYADKIPVLKKLECSEGEVPKVVGGELNCSVNSANSQTIVTLMPTEQNHVGLGKWGGAGISLTAAETRTHLEFNCALGVINEPLVLDHDGNFEIAGIYVFAIGGPRTKDSPKPKQYPAVFQGLADRFQMVLTVTVTLSESTRRYGPFSLELGRRAEFDRCG